MPTVVILGARSPIALAIASRFALAQFDIELIARDTESLEPSRTALVEEYGVEVATVEVDATDSAAVVRLLARYEQAVPAVVISVLGRQEVAGHPRDDPDYIDGLIEANLAAPMMLLERFASLLEQAGEGTLIGVSSVVGDRGRAKNYTYGAAKAGFSTFLSGLRQRLSRSGVHVITVKPGVVQRPDAPPPDHPALLVASPERVARDVFAAWRASRSVVYTPWFWRWIMLAVKLVPEGLFKRMRF